MDTEPWDVLGDQPHIHTFWDYGLPSTFSSLLMSLLEIVARSFPDTCGTNTHTDSTIAAFSKHQNQGLSAQQRCAHPPKKRLDDLCHSQNATQVPPDILRCQFYNVDAQDVDT